MDNLEKNEILAAIEKINVKVDIMQKDISGMQKAISKIPEMQKEISKIPEMQREISKMQKEVSKIPEMQKEISKIPAIQKEIREINRSVAVIEHEQGDKLKVLFDAFLTNKDKLERQEKRMDLYEKKQEKHEAQIEYLMTKVHDS